MPLRHQCLHLQAPVPPFCGGHALLRLGWRRQQQAAHGHAAAVHTPCQLLLQVCQRQGPGKHERFHTI